MTDFKRLRAAAEQAMSIGFPLCVVPSADVLALLARVDELEMIACADAEHFEETDAPLGEMARLTLGARP